MCLLFRDIARIESPLSFSETAVTICHTFGRITGKIYQVTNARKSNLTWEKEVSHLVLMHLTPL